MYVLYALLYGYARPWTLRRGRTASRSRSLRRCSCATASERLTVPRHYAVWLHVTCLALQCHHRTVGSRAMAAWTSLTLIVPMPLGTRARGHFLSFPLYNLRNADRTREIGNREVHPARAGRLLFIRVSDDEGRPPRSRQPAWGRVLLALEWHRRAKCYEMQNPARVRTHGKRGAGGRLGRPARTRRAAMALGKGSPRHILKRTAGLAE